MTTEHQTKTAAGGRPRGARNKTYAEALEIPAACPRCGSAELKVLKGSKKIERPELVGRLAGGFTYRGVTWRRKQCACGQLVIVREYSPAPKN